MTGFLDSLSVRAADAAHRDPRGHDSGTEINGRLTVIDTPPRKSSG